MVLDDPEGDDREGDDREGDDREGDDREGRAMAAAPGLAARWHCGIGGEALGLSVASAASASTTVRLVNAAAVCRPPWNGRWPGRRLLAAAYLRRDAIPVRAAFPERYLACELAEPVAVLPEMLADPALAIAECRRSGHRPLEAGLLEAGNSRSSGSLRRATAKGRPFLNAIEARVWNRAATAAGRIRAEARGRARGSSAH